MANNIVQNVNMFLAVLPNVDHDFDGVDILRKRFVRRGPRPLNTHVITVLITRIPDDHLKAQAAQLIADMHQGPPGQRVVDIIGEQMRPFFDLLRGHMLGDYQFVALQLAYQVLQGQNQRDADRFENDLFGIFVMQYNDGTFANWLCDELQRLNRVDLIAPVRLKGQQQQQLVLAQRPLLIQQAQQIQPEQLAGMLQQQAELNALILEQRQQAINADNNVLNANENVEQRAAEIAELNQQLLQAQALVINLPPQLEDLGRQLEALRQAQQAAIAAAEQLREDLLANRDMALHLQQQLAEHFRLQFEQEQQQLRAQAADAALQDDGAALQDDGADLPAAEARANNEPVPVRALLRGIRIRRRRERINRNARPPGRVLQRHNDEALRQRVLLILQEQRPAVGDLIEGRNIRIVRGPAGNGNLPAGLEQQNLPEIVAPLVDAADQDQGNAGGEEPNDQEVAMVGDAEQLIAALQGNAGEQGQPGDVQGQVNVLNGVLAHLLRENVERRRENVEIRRENVEIRRENVAMRDGFVRIEGQVAGAAAANAQENDQLQGQMDLIVQAVDQQSQTLLLILQLMADRQ